MHLKELTFLASRQDLTKLILLLMMVVAMVVVMTLILLVPVILLLVGMSDQVLKQLDLKLKMLLVFHLTLYIKDKAEVIQLLLTKHHQKTKLLLCKCLEKTLEIMLLAFKEETITMQNHGEHKALYQVQLVCWEVALTSQV